VLLIYILQVIFNSIQKNLKLKAECDIIEHYSPIKGGNDGGKTLYLSISL